MPRRAMRGTASFSSLRNAGLVERLDHEALERRFVLGVGVDPARVQLRLAHRLQHVRLEPLAQDTELRSSGAATGQMPSSVW